MERDESPASQAPIDDEPLSSPLQGEVLFHEDSQNEAREFAEENGMSPSMRVSTAELLTQEPTDVEKEKSLEVVEATEIVVEERMEENESTEDDERQVEEMEDVQPSVPATRKETSSTVAENQVESKSMEQMIPPRSTQEPSPIAATQDDSLQSRLSSISSGQSAIVPQPPSYLPQRHFSRPHQQSFHIFPPNATPATPAPLSAQIQVRETPLPAQRPAQEAPIPFTSATTRISATAPSPMKAPTEPALRRGHKRDRQVGPIIPRFSRRERKINRDLKAILLENRNKLGAQKKENGGDDVQNAMQVDPIVEEVVKESFEAKKPGTIEPETPVQEVQNATQGDTVMEEIVEASFEAEKPRALERETLVQEVQNATQEATTMQEISKESVEPENSEETNSQKLHPALQAATQGDKEQRRLKKSGEESLVTENRQTVERKEEIVVTRIKNVTVPPAEPQLDDTQDDSQTFEAAKSRWGRFAAHWRRFPSSS